jgi:hypothetical protein
MNGTNNNNPLNNKTMKTIKIENKEQVNTAIQEAEGKAKTRLLSYEAIEDAIQKVEKRFKTLGVPKKHWNGAWFQIIPEALPNSYKQRAEGTGANICYKNGWRVESVFRTYCKKCAYGSERSVNIYAEHIRPFIQI